MGFSLLPTGSVDDIRMHRCYVCRVNYVRRFMRSADSSIVTAPFAIATTLLLLSLAPVNVMARESDPSRQDSSSQYLEIVKPLLEKHCYACHSGLKQAAGLRLDTAAFILQGGESGPILNTSQWSESEILKRITATDDSVMPPKHEGERLSETQVKQIETWLQAGVAAIPNEEPSFSPDQHWAFQPIPARSSQFSRLELLELSSKNPVDLLLGTASLSTASSVNVSPEPNQSAPLLTVLRRLSVDLRGLPVEEELVARLVPSDLPPTQSETTQPSSLHLDQEHLYEELVEKWLADPAYGERWARHWMDVWRYSDWWGLGEELRNSQLHMWHWRDWIVESLNANVPYDEMIRQMIAADELYPEEPSKLRATGYLARNFFLFNRNQWMDETVEHVGKGILGLTMNCAKCHDHKYDPISQIDYYRFRAIFEPYHVRLDMLDGQADFRRNGLPRVFDRDIDTPTYLFVRGEESKPDKSRLLAPGVPNFLSIADYKPEAIPLPSSSYQPESREVAIRTYLAQSNEKMASLKKKRDAAQAAMEQLVSRWESLQNNQANAEDAKHRRTDHEQMRCG